MVDTYMILGWALGIPATILGLIALFYGIKAANVFGGELGESLKKVIIGLFLFVFSSSFTGIVMVGFGIREAWTALIGAGMAFIGGIFCVVGLRKIVEIQKK